MRVVLAGGGTAGHIEPALNLADELVRRHPGTEVVALGTARGLEGRLVPERGYRLELIPAVPMPRQVSADVARLPVRLVTAVSRTRVLLRAIAPDVVVGFGGYVAMPAYLAARGRYPIVVHEANARAGLANRVAARWANAVAQSVPGTLPNAVLTGNPLRRAIAELDRAAQREVARRYFDLSPQSPVLLVFGGSQGARRINEVVTELVATDPGCVVLHAHGAGNPPVAVTSDWYRPLPYIDRMDLAYAAADLALCRSGAMTVAEIAAVGLPACFVPLPFGNGEQELNGRPAVAAGAALQVPDAELSVTVLRRDVLPLLQNPQQLHDMGRRARELGRPNAAQALADLVEQVVASQ
jgi:UDP-N-acetylglucosamine--N-acetylmuramyl-(pentapeptide) pyrophosphoryl-undecaprenol N-acetylglucosamine transferase